MKNAFLIFASFGILLIYGLISGFFLYPEDFEEFGNMSAQSSNPTSISISNPTLTNNDTEYLQKIIDRYEKQDQIELNTTTLTNPDDTKISNLIQEIFPESITKYIYQISNESDGPDETIAFVEPLNPTGGDWLLSYDPVDVFDENNNYLEKEILLATLVHEIAHIISLNNSQVDHIAEGEEVNCGNNELPLNEGCALSSSYIYNFTERFWTVDEISIAQKNEEDVEAQEDFYNQDPSKFVTMYAATNEAEDLAESFTFFVFGERATGSTLKDQKINFFYDYPELVNIREHIRSNI